MKKQIVDTEEAVKDAEEGAIVVPSNATAVQILNRFQKEGAMHDLHQFISNSGLFNLDQLNADLVLHWGEQLRIEKFLLPGNGRLVQNEELGKLINNLYK